MVSVAALFVTFLRFCDAAKAKPNILFLMTDSLDGRIVEPGTPQAAAVDLPFMRGFLVDNGVNFVRSYSNNPMCVPSRTSMMTGRSVDRINVWGNRQGLAASPGGVLDDNCVKNNGESKCRAWAKEQGNPETIFSTMKGLGYKVHADGRLHIGAGMLNAQDHDGKVEGYQSCTPFDSTRAGEVTRSADIRSSPGPIFKATFLEDAKDDAEVDTSFGAADWGAVKNCQRFIDGLPEPSKATQPFFLHCSLNLPHYTFSTNATWLKSVHLDQLSVPKWLPGFPEAWHPYDSFMSIAKGVDDEFSEEDILKLQRVYYGMVAESDAMLSAVWNALTEKGYSLDDTYVLVVSDHGEMKFEHRQMNKASMYEGSVRVPLQIAGPGVKKGLRVDSHITSLLDVFPTLLDMAQVTDKSAYSALSGKSVLAVAGAESSAPADMRLAADADDRDMIVSQYNWVEANTGAYMLRSGDWKYITYGHTYSNFKDYKPQLFNVAEDPDELQNLADSKPLIVRQLDKKLRTVLDPDEVDKKVAKSDFEFLQDRFGASSLLQGSTELFTIVRKPIQVQFFAWMQEASNMFAKGSLRGVKAA
eukprot:TRINITY_DN4158_c0_g2_i1.p1 TRINITY_DN4158_c0_g2~~TRINITY_DN4158_c0_g2_i1.p1  ORF type:complete len:610 (-),score=140.58 TRINITY_DN4158_c0_g2_i1:49-1803(-)